MWTRLRSHQFSTKTAPWVFALVGILAYGLLTPWLGFYWDDWVFVWLLKHNGPVELARSFLPYDPLVSPFFLITSSIFGTNAFAWQIFGLAVRVIVSLGALWTFNQIWPEHARKVIWAALFFLVYPGYAQQWIAFTHANQEWISFGFMILSLGLTARSLREPASRKWLVFALITQFIGLATTEYFLGMEFLRPVIIWIVLSQLQPEHSKHFFSTLKTWAIYIPIWLIAGIGQYLYHKSGAYGGHSFGMSLGLREIPQLIFSLLRDIIPTLRVVAFDAWAQTFNLITTPLASLTDWLTLGLVVFSFVGLAFYLSHLHRGQNENAKGDTWALQAMFLGLVGILGGRLPSWLAGLQIVLRFDWDRLLISLLFGVSLFTAGLLDFLIKRGYRKQLLISLILALAIGMQFQQANTFRRDWQNQKNFFWQLAWRAPMLKPGTMLVTDQMSLQYVADLQLSAPLNLMYAPDAKDFPYILLYTKNRLGGSLLPKLSPRLPVEGRYRTVEFESTTSKIVLFQLWSDGCLQLLDPAYVSEDALPGLPQNITSSLDISNMGQVDINSDSQAEPSKYFGAEPAHAWCYYFEKAELARQFNGWEEITQLYESASSAGYTALQPSENLVFIEAFALLGDIHKAGQLNDETISQDHKLCKALVAVWERAVEASPELGVEAGKKIDSLKDLSECN
jgi:hypothetical protein